MKSFSLLRPLKQNPPHDDEAAIHRTKMKKQSHCDRRATTGEEKA
jgi:hypothetical protein